MISSNYSLCSSIYLRTSIYFRYVHFLYIWELSLSLINNSNARQEIVLRARSFSYRQKDGKENRSKFTNNKTLQYHLHMPTSCIWKDLPGTLRLKLHTYDALYLALLGGEGEGERARESERERARENTFKNKNIICNRKYIECVRYGTSTVPVVKNLEAIII